MRTSHKPLGLRHLCKFILIIAVVAHAAGGADASKAKKKSPRSKPLHRGLISVEDSNGPLPELNTDQILQRRLLGAKPHKHPKPPKGHRGLLEVDTDADAEAATTTVRHLLAAKRPRHPGPPKKDRGLMETLTKQTQAGIIGVQTDGDTAAVRQLLAAAKPTHPSPPKKRPPPRIRNPPGPKHHTGPPKNTTQGPMKHPGPAKNHDRAPMKSPEPAMKHPEPSKKQPSAIKPPPPKRSRSVMESETAEDFQIGFEGFEGVVEEAAQRQLLAAKPHKHPKPPQGHRGLMKVDADANDADGIIAVHRLLAAKAHKPPKPPKKNRGLAEQDLEAEADVAAVETDDSVAAVRQLLAAKPHKKHGY